MSISDTRLRQPYRSQGTYPARYSPDTNVEDLAACGGDDGRQRGGGGSDYSNRGYLPSMPSYSSRITPSTSTTLPPGAAARHQHQQRPNPNPADSPSRRSHRASSERDGLDGSWYARSEDAASTEYNPSTVGVQSEAHLIPPSSLPTVYQNQSAQQAAAQPQRQPQPRGPQATRQDDYRWQTSRREEGDGQEVEEEKDGQYPYRDRYRGTAAAAAPAAAQPSSYTQPRTTYPSTKEAEYLDEYEYRRRDDRPYYPRNDSGYPATTMSKDMLEGQQHQTHVHYKEPYPSSSPISPHSASYGYAQGFTGTPTSSGGGGGAGGATTSKSAAGGGHTNIASILKGYGTTHQLLYLLTVILQTIASMILIALIWAKIKSGTPANLDSSLFNDAKFGTVDDENLRRRSITVYLVIFIFGSIFEIVTALDALRLNNTIQLIGVCLFTAAMMLYAALLDGQIKNAVNPELGYPENLYHDVKPYILAMPIIQGVAACVLSYFTWLLFKDFGWEVLHLIGADRKLKRMYTRYQIYVCLLKFDFFFFVGFSLQYCILVLQVQEAEFIITIVAFPVTVLFLFLAVVSVRREIRWLTPIIVLVEFCGLAYFVFKLVRLFQASQAFRYQTSRKTLAVFSALAIAMLLATAIDTVVCWRNFGKGLKEAIPGYWGEHKNTRRQRLARKGSLASSAHLNGHSGFDNGYSGGNGMPDNRQSRMSID